MALELNRIPTLAAEYAQKNPKDIVALAIKEYGGNIRCPSAAPRMSSSSTWPRRPAETSACSRSIPVVCTPRRTSSWRRCASATACHRHLLPEPEAVQKLVREKGLFSFFKDGTRSAAACARSSPAARPEALAAWVTGQRRDQSRHARRGAGIQIDPTFGSAEKTLVKFNPLANWSSKQCGSTSREHVPYNPLHERGFVSIGCEPCTRPVNPGQHEREGRWWWKRRHEGVRSPRRQRRQGVLSLKSPGPRSKSKSSAVGFDDWTWDLGPTFDRLSDPPISSDRPAAHAPCPSPCRRGGPG